MWTCPKCNRSFRLAGQQHSCNVAPLELHFGKRPQYLRDIYDHIVAEVGKFGHYEIAIIKAGIFFRAGANFMYLRPKKDHVVISFFLARELQEFPIAKTMRISSTRVSHVVHLQSVADLDAQVLSWIKESYDIVSG